MEVTKHDPGRFCWVELSTSDGPAAKKFYTTLFGWSFVDNPMGDAGVYTMLQKNGKDVGALYQMGPEQKGIPPNWGSYVAVENANDAAAHAKELGATVMLEPFDVMEHGRMAVLQDPAGAVFSLWEPKSHIGARVVNEPGSFCWNELYTTDPSRAAEFYMGLFGWTKDSKPHGHGRVRDLQLRRPERSRDDEDPERVGPGPAPLDGLLRGGRLRQERRQGEGSRGEGHRNADGHPGSRPLRDADGPAGCRIRGD